jgi:hypothetical protein
VQYCLPYEEGVGREGLFDLLGLPCVHVIFLLLLPILPSLSTLFFLLLLLFKGPGMSQNSCKLQFPVPRRASMQLALAQQQARMEGVEKKISVPSQKFGII